eukprot:TRINITY_DN10643_c0_g1_i2.p2 TRINITY_DN10643_c0_g1~~TRINITY_DN10643_c0_g1_i2.p2  ORF type:complete len:103 (+),score=17.19 TRINITY_DN10643_c0_g1_i2:699-1007(+)
MLYGVPPFYDEDRQKMYNFILYADIPFPSSIHVSPDAITLMEMLLKKNPESRLGFSEDAEDIKSHPWFHDTNWADVYLKKIEPPFRVSSTPSKQKGSINVKN